MANLTNIPFGNDLYMNNLPDEQIDAWNEYFLSSGSNLSIATHDGLFHCDDVTAVALIQLSIPEHKAPSEWNIVRTRNPEEIDKCRFKLDVGGKFNTSLGYLDHHQRGGAGPVWYYNGNEYPVATAGLLWSLHGNEVIKNVLHLTEGSEITAQIYNELAPIFFQIDLTDTGNSLPVSSLMTPMGLSSVISCYNTTTDPYKESGYQSMRFQKAVEVISTVIITKIEQLYQAFLFEQYCEDHFDPQSPVLNLAKAGNWRSWILKNWEKTQNIKLVIFPSGEAWRVQTVQAEIDNPMSMRCPAPETLKGRRGDELKNLIRAQAEDTNPLFVHPNGFIGGAGIYMDAMRLVSAWLHGNNVIQ